MNVVMKYRQCMRVEENTMESRTKSFPPLPTWQWEDGGNITARREGLLTMSQRCVTTVLSLGLAFLMIVCADLAWAGSASPKVFGKTYGEWAAKWWQWALAGPAGENAVQDTTGEFCDANQPKGKVWFLAGTFGGTVTRTCTIPKRTQE